MFWQHEMSKHKTENTFHFITWEIILLMKFGQFMHHYKMNFFLNNSLKIAAWKLVPGPL